MSKLGIRAVLAAFMGVAGAAAQAVPLTFSCASANGAQCGAVAAQLSMNVVDLGGGHASFAFANSGAIHSSVTGFFWNGSTGLIGGGAIAPSAGASFSWDLSSSNVGGGIKWNAAFSANANAPVSPNGVHPGESVQFTLGYTGGFDTMVASLNNGLALHVQSIGANGVSEWMLAAPISAPIPEPQTYALMLGGLGLLGFMARRRRR